MSNTNITHPTYTFKVNLDVDNVYANLHPDMHSSDPDAGRTNSLAHKDRRSTWIPGLLAGSNIELKDDNTFTINGEEGTYLNKYFTVSRDGHPALLTLQ